MSGDGARSPGKADTAANKAAEGKIRQARARRENRIIGYDMREMNPAGRRVIT